MADGNQAEALEDVQGDELRGDESTTTEAGAPGSTYDPSNVEATRARQRGLGVGQKDLDGQRDPTGSDSSTHYGSAPDGDGQEASGGDAGPSGVGSQAGPPGRADKAYDDRDRDKVDTDCPAG